MNGSKDSMNSFLYSGWVCLNIGISGENRRKKGGNIDEVDAVFHIILL